MPLLPGSGLLSDATSARPRASRAHRLPGDARRAPPAAAASACSCAATLARLAELLRVGASARSARTSATAACSSRRFVERARHIEVQIFGDGKRPRGRARRARLLGAAPQSEGDRGDAGAAAAPRACERTLFAGGDEARYAAVRYRSAGTVEFVYDDAPSSSTSSR